VKAQSARLLKAGKPVAKVVPARKPRTGHSLAALWERLPLLIVKAAEALGRDLERARRNLPPLMVI
jgi:antitoxin (DNA-binding transcriptional repressor) of toxin-antitoxin stability system